MRSTHAHDLVSDDVFLQLDDFISRACLLLKIEGFNLTGSVKLKTALGLVEDAERKGLYPGGRVIESSSGNLGVALGAVCAAKGYAFTCVTDPNTSARSVAAMRAYGAEVISVTLPDANGGFLGSRIDYIHERLREDPDLVWTNQYANPANPRVHYERTAASILKETSNVDHLFVGAGTTGTLMGCVEYFREHSPWTRIVGVDAEGSVTFGSSPSKRHIPGLGTSRKPELCRSDVVDDVVLVSESDTIRTCRRLAVQRGLLMGGSTGSVLAAVERMSEQLPDGAHVVAIAPDLGERYLDTIYNDSWVEERFGPAALDSAPRGGRPMVAAGA